MLSIVLESKPVERRFSFNFSFYISPSDLKSEIIDTQKGGELPEQATTAWYLPCGERLGPPSHPLR